MSPFDVTLVFQRMSEILPNQQGIVDQVSVSFSPQQFKALVRSLTETLTGYEEVFGALSIPDSATAPSRTASQIVELIQSIRDPDKANLSSNEPPPPSEQSHGEPRKKGRRP
jgi:hypothetical protein